MALQESLRLSNEDERVLLHLPKRGLPGFAVLLDSGHLGTWAGSTAFLPEIESTRNRVLENRRDCFRLVKELALSPEALRLDGQAGELTKQINKRRANWPDKAVFWAALAEIRSFYERAKDLPKMSPQEFARERAESAVMAPPEYLDSTGHAWPYQQLERQIRRGEWRLGDPDVPLPS